METLTKIESDRNIKEAVFSKKILAGDGWMYELKPGQVLRIVDLEGNQAVDTLFFDSENLEDHYSAVATITAQSSVNLTAG